MTKPLICLTLTGKTLEENADLVKKYAKRIDVAELRVDCLNEDEQLYARKFPSMIQPPCLLTIRRDVDGGKYSGSEFSRTNLFARALAYANQDKTRNFAYVDFEEDYYIPSIQDAALAFNVRIIRSVHNFEGPITNLKERCESMRRTGYEIPKIAFMPKTLDDVTNMFREGEKLTQYDHIFVAMGNLGFPSRVLSAKSNSYLTYVSPEETMGNVAGIGQINPVAINDLYRFRSINEETKIFGVTGWPLIKTSSPEIHNQGYIAHDMNAVYIPIRAQKISDALGFAENLGIEGMSITVPHKEMVMDYLSHISEEATAIGAVNTIAFRNNSWTGYNTDAYGFRRALEEFMMVTKLKRKKIAIIGAGGAAKAIAYVIKQMGGKACVFNRTLSSAKSLAKKYGFDYCELNPSATSKLEHYSDLIVQTTSVGMNSTDESNEDTDPIYFYNFKGSETVFDIVYTPAITPVMRRAARFGCRTCNGLKMLQYQGYEQFKIFTGEDYENGKS